MTPTTDETGKTWPRWARTAASVALGLHLVAILAASWAAPPSSPLQRALAEQFATYYQLIDQGYTYRYFAPEPPPTPVLLATLRFADGRPDRTLTIPDRTTRPRLLYQRQLALANHLYKEFEEARNLPPEVPPPPLHWATSYARHLGHVHGCESVVLSVRQHLIPNLGQVRETLERSGGGSVNLDDEENYTVPVRIGEFPCNAS
jgi:hypothetical protein